MSARQTVEIAPRDGETILCCDHVGPNSDDKTQAHLSAQTINGLVMTQFR